MAPQAPAAGDWLALYGSLMRGLGAMERLGVGRGLRFAGPCRCPGELYDLGDYPGLCPGPATVVAELYAILDASVLRDIDAFEDYSPASPSQSLYLRERIRLVEPTGTTAWVYHYNRVPEAAARVESGDWRAHLEGRRRSDSV